jgi:KRAB domain-containing zinc finger protein
MAAYYVPSFVSKQFECEICSKKVATFSNLIGHIETIHLKIYQLKCDFCDHVCNLKENLKKHMIKWHFGMETFMCDRCDFRSFFKSELDRHLKYAKNENQKKTKKQKKSVVKFPKNVSKILNVKKKFRCGCNLGNCGYSTDYRQHFYRHMSAMHLKLKKKFQCELCDYCTYERANFQRHVNAVHLKLKQFSCYFCCMEYSSKQRLNRHKQNCKVKKKF